MLNCLLSSNSCCVLHIATNELWICYSSFPDIMQGPIVAEAIFLNREELPVHPVYYDPVHDFGFLRFDPSKLQFMQVRSCCGAVLLLLRLCGCNSGVDQGLTSNITQFVLTAAAITWSGIDRFPAV